MRPLEITFYRWFILWLESELYLLMVSRGDYYIRTDKRECDQSYSALKYGKKNWVKPRKVKLHKLRAKWYHHLAVSSARTRGSDTFKQETNHSIENGIRDDDSSVSSVHIKMWHCFPIPLHVSCWNNFKITDKTRVLIIIEFSNRLSQTWILMLSAWSSQFYWSFIV